MRSGGLALFQNSNPDQFTGRVFLYNQLMELFLGATVFTAFVVVVAAIDEQINWLKSYDKAGEDDRQHQSDKQDDYDIGYRE